jgi:hypothetical protein
MDRIADDQEMERLNISTNPVKVPGNCEQLRTVRHYEVNYRGDQMMTIELERSSVRVTE